MKIKKPLKIIIVIIISGRLIGGGYYAATKLVNNKSDSQKELDETVKSVGKLMYLPEDEVPTLATVTDVNKLEGQPFFARAQTGDKILIYTNNQKIVLYSPKTNKIVEVGALNLNQNRQ
jgi:hypothetical protein